MLELLTGRKSYDRLVRPLTVKCFCLVFTSVSISVLSAFFNLKYLILEKNIYLMEKMCRTRPRAEQSLARWAIPQLHDIDALSRMVDPAVNGAYPIKSLSRFADIISRCVQVSLFMPLSL